MLEHEGCPWATPPLSVFAKAPRAFDKLRSYMLKMYAVGGRSRCSCPLTAVVMLYENIDLADYRSTLAIVDPLSSGSTIAVLQVLGVQQPLSESSGKIEDASP